MIKWLKKLFSYNLNISKPLVTIETADVFDTVWIKDKNTILQGWIYEKTKKSFRIVAKEKEYIFHYKRPLDKTEITFNNKVLYFNKPC